MANGDRLKSLEALRFLEQFVRDQEEGVTRSLDEYVELFPAYPEVIRREYRVASAKDDHEVEGGELEAGLPGDLTFGRYRVEREIGRGGHGVVYRAIDVRLNRRVALKVLAGPLFRAEELRRRFVREAEAASQLDHPRICAVYELGEEYGVPYIAMRYVDGETLSRRIASAKGAVGGDKSSSMVEMSPPGDLAQPDRDLADSRSSGPRTHRAIMQVVELIEKVARALHAAHEASLIHRDIKPDNIMITPEGEPVILDFGLARVEESDAPTLTGPGELVGTPAYMSPEQLTARRDTLDRRTDVYSLGVTLYECLTLRRPFVGKTREHLFQRILGTEPRNPRRLNPRIPRDLRVILETALAKDRERRYGSALDFAEDLRRLRENEPTVARPLGPVGRVLRFTKRRPARAALLGMLVICLPLFVVMGAHIVATRPVIEDQRRRVDREAVEKHLAEAWDRFFGEDDSFKGDSRGFADALVSFDRALALDPKCAEALYGTTLVLMAQERFTACLAVLDEKSTLTESDPRLQLQRVTCLWRLGRFVDAALALARIPRAGPPLSPFLMGLPRWSHVGDARAEVKQMLEMLEESLSIRPGRLSGAGTPRPSATVRLNLVAPRGAGLRYQVASSFGGGSDFSGFGGGGLSADGLFCCSVNDRWPAIFCRYRGVFDTNGRATAAINIPGIAELVGQTVHTVFVTLDPTAPAGIRGISNRYSFTIVE